MRALLEMTLWKTPKMGPYGWFHFGFLAIGLPICWWLAKKLATPDKKRIDRTLWDTSDNKHIDRTLWASTDKKRIDRTLWAPTDKKRIDRVLRATSIFLIVTEIYKQLLFLFVLGRDGYDWSVLPLQFCSMPMYLAWIASYTSTGRIRQALLDYLLWFNLFGAVMGFVGPQGMFWGYWTLNIHSFLWHLALIFQSLFLYYSGAVSNARSHFSDTLYIYAAYVILALGIDLALPADSGINLLYISPYQGNTVIIFDEIYRQFGWWAANVPYIAGIPIGAYGVYRWTVYWNRKKGRYEL